MNQKIFEQIKKYNNIVIARHINVDPDAMASASALKESIKLTFPEKNVYLIGTGVARFNYMGKIDKNVDYSLLNDTLLIALDTPDRKRLDVGDFSNYDYSIKIDHHPFMETFCDLEFVNPLKSSASELVYELIKETDLMMDKNIAEIIFIGIVADTGRFLFNNSSSSTFTCVGDLIEEYNLDIVNLYSRLYRRPFNELQLQGYMALNMKITDNGVGYVKVTNEVIDKYKIDTASSGDSINEFNNIDEILVWLSATEDVKNNYIRVSIRSRGPVINTIAERFGGGGHKLASGVKVPSFEEVDDLINELDKLCKNYTGEGESSES